MDTAEANVIFKEILARYNQEDKQALAQELVNRLDLKCQSSWEDCYKELVDRVGRDLNSTEKAQARYFYDKELTSPRPEKKVKKKGRKNKAPEAL